jgi:hypothetical protein
MVRKQKSNQITKTSSDRKLKNPKKPCLIEEDQTPM